MLGEGVGTFSPLFLCMVNLKTLSEFFRFSGFQNISDFQFRIFRSSVFSEFFRFSDPFRRHLVLTHFPFPSILLKAQEQFGCGWQFVKPGFTCFSFNICFMPTNICDACHVLCIRHLMTTTIIFHVGNGRFEQIFVMLEKNIWVKRGNVFSPSSNVLVVTSKSFAVFIRQAYGI